jgi:hypothetical protein
MGHHETVIGLMEAGELEFKAIESWLRDRSKTLGGSVENCAPLESRRDRLAGG